MWCCTWETGVFAGQGLAFVEMTGFSGGRCVVVGLPCAVRGVYAHGSGIVVVAGVAVPHDSAVPTDAERARVCNIHRRSTRGLRVSGFT